VATIVTKLFNIVAPDIAVFGEKDYQQQLIVKRIVKDLNMDIEIETAPTVREQDGLAMSSRNSYLDEDAREAALCVPRSLERACRLFSEGERSVERIGREMRAVIETSRGAQVDYISICEPESLAEAVEAREGLLVAVSVKVAVVGKGAQACVRGNAVGDMATALAGRSVRLIDNCKLDKKHVKISG